MEANGGATWMKLDNGLPSDNPVTQTAFSTAGRLFATVGASAHFPDIQNDRGVYLSDDGGENWRSAGPACGHDIFMSPGDAIFVAC